MGAWDVGEAVKVTLPASRSTSSNLYSKSSEIYRYSSLLPCSCPLVTYVGYRAYRLLRASFQLNNSKEEMRSEDHTQTYR